MTILRNAAQCARCGTVIESRHRHDFVSCPCGAIFVDGGRDYIRHGWQEDGDLISLVETDGAA